jgi:hypothetical protein
VVAQFSPFCGRCRGRFCGGRRRGLLVHSRQQRSGSARHEHATRLRHRLGAADIDRSEGIAAAAAAVHFDRDIRDVANHDTIAHDETELGDDDDGRERASSTAGERETDDIDCRAARSPMSPLEVVVAAVVVSAALLFPAAARAQASNDDQAQAARLKSAGDDAMAAKRYDEALDDYQRSYALVPNPALHYNRGRVLQFLARYPEALDAISRFDAEASPELKARVPGLPTLVAELRSKVATITIKTNVAAGRVIVGGKDMGPAPLPGPLRVDAGQTTIDVIADGYLPYHTAVDLTGGQTTVIDAELKTRAALGLLVVRSHTGEVSVSVDGRGIGLAPAEAELSPGSHPVRVDHEGYGAASTQVVIVAGERREIFLDPLKPRPITSKWWFWTGAGVVVVGLAATIIAVALTTEKSPASGSFSPGQLSF